ncbi:hypothetical protein L1077_24290 [Pseudoalteromonas luteoviolacea]|uniref:hypothetical protein n=1 Tax=Pseudoalteromonas luteoviolacea TaxID=43657 RepID=UPI001F33FA90|nr:hypothetical protein [Pseudoalteromonas luteoviolacea]MCF6442553.1 hypothetical protein [Pseudoalteromonas luteoviolacea]
MLLKLQKKQVKTLSHDKVRLPNAQTKGIAGGQAHAQLPPTEDNSGTSSCCQIC